MSILFAARLRHRLLPGSLSASLTPRLFASQRRLSSLALLLACGIAGFNKKSLADEGKAFFIEIVEIMLLKWISKIHW
jgi:hypothetical protein